MNTETTTAAPAAEKSFQVIIRGRMPIAAVALAKSLSAVEGNSDTVLAAKFNTTTGKIHDIRTSRCFGYIDSEFKPTAEQVTEAKSWLGRHKDGAESEVVKSLIDQLDKMEVASAEDAAAFLAKRAGARKTEVKLDEAGNPIPKAPRAKKEKKPKVDKAATADAAAASAGAGAGDGTNVDDLLS